MNVSRYMMFSIIVLFLNLSLVFSDISNITENTSKLIIDNDAGGDDAMAIFLALLYEKHYNGPKLIGLTTVNGNTEESNVCINNQRILKVAKRQDVPIYRGSKASLVTTPAVTGYYGKDGLGDSGEPLTDLVPAQTQNAVATLIEMSKVHKDQLIVVAIGSLTNIALAVKLDPDFISRLAHLYVGAGHIYSETSPSAEFNAHMDVEAYRVIAQNATSEKVTFVPFSQVQESLNFSLSWRKDVLGAIDTDIMKSQNIYERNAFEKEERWLALDPAVVAAAVKPDLIQEYKYSKNDIILCGAKRGINSNDFSNKEDANARIVYAFKTEEYKKFLIDLFSLN